MRTSTTLTALLIALAPLFGACQAQDEAPASKAKQASAPATESTADRSTSGGGTRATASGGEQTGRMIIRTGDLRVETEEPAKEASRLERAVRESGGYVEEASAGRRRANLTLRVPSGDFGGVVERVRECGTVVKEEVSGRDVTRKYRDLKAEITNKEALEARMRAMLQRSGDLEAALKVEKELARVRTEIQKLEERRKGMAHDISMATIRVTLRAPNTTSGPTIGDKLGAAFADAGDNFVSVCTALIRVTGGLLPLGILGALGIAAVVVVVRRR